MTKITSIEWKRIHKDYKSINNGQKYIMINDGGTCLTPVEIDDIDGLEMAKYTFTEFGIKYSVLAYTEQDALKTIKNCGHIMKHVTELTREYSLASKVS